MPPKCKLPDSVVADFDRWIALGAPDPRTAAAPARGTLDGAAARRHWAFRPIRRPPIPEIKDRLWSLTPVDPFVLARLESLGLSPAAPADKRTLIRRVTFDLIGLPPSPEEVEAFVADESPEALAKVVDRLLASPHYGERWGRHWLDVVRYADTAGETADFPAPHAWRYRNYVIAAFNADRPYDEFVREQIAGDILAASAGPQRYAELVTATGYLAIARRFGFDAAKDHYLTIEDAIDTLGKSVLGLTIGCARCHDHKYDPVTMEDYYGLYGILDSTKFAFPGCEKEKQPRDMVPLTSPAAPAQKGAGAKTVEVAYAVTEGTPHHARLHRRGDPESLGNEVPRRFLQLWGGEAVRGGGSGRLALAGWLTGPANPLTARVIVNRVWQQHFGHGLVRTPNDFGTRGAAPTHPELLDYLADRFMAEGWSLKKLHRIIVLSATYQQSSANPQSADPDNFWLARFPRRRLSAEEIRDAILTVSGDLERTPGGPHPFPDAKSWQFTQHNPFTAVYEHDRRSVYLMTQRLSNGTRSWGCSTAPIPAAAPPSGSPQPCRRRPSTSSTTRSYTARPPGWPNGCGRCPATRPASTTCTASASAGRPHPRNASSRRGSSPGLPSQKRIKTRH
jgi:hypothetical protein